MTLGERLKKQRQRKQWTQHALACEAGVSQGIVARLESGNVQDPSMSIIRKLAVALGITSDYLIGMYDHLDHESRPQMARATL